ncbi:MAG: NADH-quinone oxidoreductase subunit NuoF [Methanosarcinales archaeon]|nr:NADH-quinone oxidoreductase subunit NuoF [Methanosarcinales archaeon]
MRRLKDIQDLKVARERAADSWEELCRGPRSLVCVGMATCGISALAKETESILRETLAEKGIDARLMQVGCLGLCYAEPLVYIRQPPGELICYGRATPGVARELALRAFGGQGWPERALGVLDMMGPTVQSAQPAPADLQAAGGPPSIWDHPMMKSQVRIALSNCGIIDPQDVGHYLARGGYQGLEKAFSLSPEAIIQEVKVSGLRGRGGAGFPTGVKWEFCKNAPGDEKYLICNADEGDPGAFMDRSILEGDPHSVIEGMLIAARAMGSTEGFIYCRAEYPLALKRLEVALGQAREAGLLGEDILGAGMDFDIHIKQGAGAFVCGEETALMASIEGRRGMPRTRPPFPANSGLWGQPTNINNVETLANLHTILERGGQWYQSYGTGRSRGTKTLSLAGAIKRTGLVEVPMGISLQEIVHGIGGGILGDRACKGVLTGGPSGGCIPGTRLDVPVDYEALAEMGSIVGSGSMIVLDDGACMVDLARFFLAFIQMESCGKCTPCRIGTRQMLNILDRIAGGEAGMQDLDRLEKLATVVKNGSLCGLGQTAPNPVLTTLRHFRNEYLEHIQKKRCPSKVCRGLVSFHIDPEMCKGCGLCLDSCPAGAISGQSGEVHVIDEDRCIRCGACFQACPEKFGAVSRLSGAGHLIPCACGTRRDD